MEPGALHDGALLLAAVIAVIGEEAVWKAAATKPVEQLWRAGHGPLLGNDSTVDIEEDGAVTLVVFQPPRKKGGQGTRHGKEAPVDRVEVGTTGSPY